MLWGVDFTCAPSRRKPITLAVGRWVDGVLMLQRIDTLADMAAFQTLLHTPGPWIGAFDFPFGLPRAFVDAQQLGDSMDAVIDAVHRRCDSRMAMRRWIDEWSATRPPGSRLPHRRTDVTHHGVSSTSPLQTRYVPVAWMYFEGVRQMVQADVGVPGLRRGRTGTVALEGYPGLVAHALVGRRSYKNTDDAARSQTREAMLSTLESGAHRFGVRVQMNDGCREHALRDASGDALDALLCLVQAAWATRESTHGMPADVDAVEGWIVGA